MCDETKDIGRLINLGWRTCYCGCNQTGKYLKIGALKRWKLLIFVLSQCTLFTIHDKFGEEAAFNLCGNIIFLT